MLYGGQQLLSSLEVRHSLFQILMLRGLGRPHKARKPKEVTLKFSGIILFKVLLPWRFGREGKGLEEQQGLNEANKEAGIQVVSHPQIDERFKHEGGHLRKKSWQDEWRSATSLLFQGSLPHQEKVRGFWISGGFETARNRGALATKSRQPRHNTIEQEIIPSSEVVLVTCDIFFVRGLKDRPRLGRVFETSQAPGKKCKCEYNVVVVLGHHLELRGKIGGRREGGWS